MVSAKFFDHVRAPLFGGRLSQEQVDGMTAILAECATEGATLEQAAYILSTAHGESGGLMQPTRENMRYSAKRIGEVFGASRRQGIPASKLAFNPVLLANTVYGGEWGRANLGNRIGTTDGWDMRGAGTGQITGYRNFDKWGRNMGLDLVGNPELLEDLKIATRALVKPMLEGWATGVKLSDCINDRKCDYVGARAVWNGSFEAKKYAANARVLEAALRADGWAPRKALPAELPSEIWSIGTDGAKTSVEVVQRGEAVRISADPILIAAKPKETTTSTDPRPWWIALLSIFGITKG